MAEGWRQLLRRAGRRSPGSRRAASRSMGGPWPGPGAHRGIARVRCRLERGPPRYQLSNNSNLPPACRSVVVGARPPEPLQGEGTATAEHLGLVHHLLNGAAGPPSLIGGIVVVRGNEHVVAIPLRALNSCSRDGVVLAHALPEQPPGDSRRTQNVVQRVSDNDCGVIPVDIHGFCSLSGCDSATASVVTMMYRDMAPATGNQ